MSHTRTNNELKEATPANFYSIINDIMDTLQDGTRYGQALIRLFQGVAEELKTQPTLTGKSQKYLIALTSLSAVLNGYTFLLAKSSAKEQRNKFAEGLCVLLAILSHLIVNNKLTNVVHTKDFRQALATFALLNASRTTQLGLRKSIGYLSPKKSNTPRTKKQEVVSTSEDLQTFYPGLESDPTCSTNKSTVKTSIQVVRKYGIAMFRLSQIVKAQLKDPSIFNILDEKVLQYHKLFTAFSSVFTGFSFLLARNSANEQHNKLGDALCIVLSMLTFMIVHNKLLDASKTKDIAQALTAIATLNVSTTAQLGLRKSIGYLFSETSKPAETTEKLEDNSLRHFYN